MGPKFDALMDSIDYVPKLPDKTPRVEFFMRGFLRGDVHCPLVRRGSAEGERQNF